VSEFEGKYELSDGAESYTKMMGRVIKVAEKSVDGDGRALGREKWRRYAGYGVESLGEREGGKWVVRETRYGKSVRGGKKVECDMRERES